MPEFLVCQLSKSFLSLSGLPERGILKYRSNILAANNKRMTVINSNCFMHDEIESALSESQMHLTSNYNFVLSRWILLGEELSFFLFSVNGATSILI